MARVPRSLITENIPAKDGEFVYADTGLPYSGKYHIISGVAYAGENEKTYPQPIPLDQVPENQFASLISTIGFATAAYQMAKQNVEMIQQTAEKIFPSTPTQKSGGEGGVTRTGKISFAQKSNDPDKIIKEYNPSSTKAAGLAAIIAKAKLDEAKKDPLYKIVEIDFNAPDANQQIDEGEKVIPGLKTFISL
jgi:hypothetical protein